MRRKIQEAIIGETSLLREAAVRIRGGEIIKDSDQVIDVIVSMVKYHPELNYICNDYTNTTEVKQGIRHQLDTRPGPFIDELLQLNGVGSN